MEEKLIKYLNKEHKKTFGVSVGGAKNELNSTQAIFDDIQYRVNDNKAADAGPGNPGDQILASMDLSAIAGFDEMDIGNPADDSILQKGFGGPS